MKWLDKLGDKFWDLKIEELFYFLTSLMCFTLGWNGIELLYNVNNEVNTYLVGSIAVILIVIALFLYLRINCFISLPLAFFWLGITFNSMIFHYIGIALFVTGLIYFGYYEGKKENGRKKRKK